MGCTAQRRGIRLILPLVLRPKPENAKCVRQLRSSTGVAVFVSEPSDRTHWVEVGRCYERFALQATALGIRHAFLNQPVEETALRPEFVKALGLGAGRPDLVVRFGRGPEMPWSLRRSLDSVLETGQIEWNGIALESKQSTPGR